MTKCRTLSDSAQHPPVPERVLQEELQGQFSAAKAHPLSHEGIHLTCFHGAFALYWTLQLSIPVPGASANVKPLRPEAAQYV